MEAFVYYIFCAMCLGGGLGVLLMPNYVNATMSMLLSMLGVAGLMLMMQAYFLAFVMVTVYAGAVLVLFVFVVMLVGDDPETSSIWKKLSLLSLWLAAGALMAYFSPQIAEYVAQIEANVPKGEILTLSSAKAYGMVLFGKFILPFQIAGALLLAAMVGVIVVAKDARQKRKTNDAI